MRKPPLYHIRTVLFFSYWRLPARDMCLRRVCFGWISLSHTRTPTPSYTDIYRVVCVAKVLPLASYRTSEPRRKGVTPVDWLRTIRSPPPHTELFWITLSYRFVITPCYYYYYYVVRVSRCYYFSRSWAVCLSSILVRAENGRVVSLAGFSLSRICGARISKRFGFPDFNCLVVTIVYCLSFIYLSIVIFRLPCFVLFVSHSLQQPPISSTYTHYIHEGWTPAPNHTHTYPPHESCYSWPVLPG